MLRLIKIARRASARLQQIGASGSFYAWNDFGTTPTPDCCHAAYARSITKAYRDQPLAKT
jgi:hypothetical protein